MKNYILKRCGYMVVTIFIIVTITFFMMRSIPGDPLASMAQMLPEQTRANFYAKYGLDQPLITQYLNYLKDLARFDFGESVVYAGRSVTETITTTSPVSALVGGIALVIGIVVGLVLGIIAAFNKNRLPDYVVMFIAIVGVSFPIFVMASLYQYYFAVKLNAFPASGWGEPKHLFLPVLVLCFGPIAGYARYMKSSVLDTLEQDYVLTARAKGLREYKVFSRHIFRNSILPIVTMIAGSIVGIFTGSFIIEKMFSIPGIGFYYISSINNNDYTMILGTTIFFAGLFVIMQLVVDIVYVFIDPRIRVTSEL